MSNNTDKNREYLIGRFESDGISAPESLSEENIMAMLPEMPVLSDTDAEISESETAFTSPAEKHGRKIIEHASVRRVVALAACLVLAVVSVPVIHRVVTAPPDTSLVNGELRSFSNYNEIENLVKSLEPEDSFFNWRLGSDSTELREYESVTEDADMATGETALSSSATGSEAGSTSVAKSASHSSTYLQVEEVDEADIVKTDGKYIYYVNNKQEVLIMSADKGKTKLLSRIGNTNIENYVNDIYLKGDTLVTIGMVYDDDDDEGHSAIVIYDISDRTRPALVSDFRQSGSVVSSRMVGDYVYLVTNDYVYSGGRVIPKATYSGEYKDIPACDICCVPEPAQSSYIILSAVDISSGESVKSATHAVFGATSDIYCNDHNLYAAVSEYDYEKNSSVTRIMRAKLEGLKIKFDATAAVRGTINNQFSMDEHDGYLRVATTSSRNGMDVNNLFVLDERLRETGKLTGFARNESIRAVRYIGDMAYVITYEAIDPLFIIDLSDPAAPVIRGEVKIDGFSSLLVPAGKGRMLGIGYATGDNGYGGEYAAGLKLALFDVSDPLEPKVIDSKEFKDMDSPAQYDHKALTVNDEEGWYAIPYGQYTDTEEEPEENASVDAGEEVTGEIEDVIIDEGSEEDTVEYEEPEYESGVLVFGQDDSIKVYDQHKLGSSQLQRCIYIGNYIYALDEEGNVSSFRYSK